MKSVVLLVLVFVAVSLALSPAFDFRKQFKDFKAVHGKSYSNPVEEERRYRIFKTNVLAAHNKSLKDKYAQYGVTQFSDLTAQEFKDFYLMNNINFTATASKPSKVIHKPRLPASFDWKDKGKVTGVKDQGQCGSCWDFSATETIESVCAIAGYPLTVLSEQQILDCDTTDGGCNGGWPYDAYQYVISAGGLETESDYPYTAQDGTCNFQPSDIECKVDSWKYVTQQQDENVMQSFLYSNSPLSVCVDAESWQFYTGGVITPSSNCGNSMDHCVQVTGWQQMQGMAVWNVRNSWGASWGVNGYLYVQIGQNVCGIAQVVTVPCVKSTSGKVVC